MRHFHRTTVTPADVLAVADDFFAALGLQVTASAARSRTLAGPLGTLTLGVKPEGGHYTFVEAHTDQVGESRLDKNVKKFFNAVHRAAEPSHLIRAGY
jgi:hypothetical protein